MIGLVGLYLAAVVAANLIVTQFGPIATVPTAFLLIGLNITARDRIHDAWTGRGLRFRMAALIGGGALLSYLINAEAAQIAIASSVAFTLSEAVDAGLYHALRRYPWLARANGSNAVSAAVDSLVFPTLAFGGFLPLIVLGQYAAKTGGGFLWSLVLRKPVVTVAAALALVAVPAQGQIVSVGPAVVSTEFGTDAAAEVFVAAPPVMDLRPNIVLSWTDVSEKPVVLAKLSRELLRDGGSFVSVEAGAAMLPFRDYHPEPIVGLYLSSPLPVKRTALAAAVSGEPWNDWAWTVVVKIDLNLWFRR